MSAETLQFTPQLYDYIKKASLREPAILEQLRKETQQYPAAVMQISPEQGQFMQFLVELMGAKKTLDIGTFTGYSALAVALALPQDGKVIACDVSKEWTKIAKKFWELAGMHNKIDLRIGPAGDTLQKLIDDGEKETFDFAFIDADKNNYDQYYEKSLTLLRRGGLLAIDNVLWSGTVANVEDQDKTVQMFRALNLKIHQDERVTMSMIPIGDGLTLARKR